MFEYMGLQTPAFDAQESFHLFATREEETPMQQRATQIYFDQEGNAAWIMFYEKDDSELHSVVKLEREEFQDAEFMIEGCT